VYLVNCFGNAKNKIVQANHTGYRQRYSTNDDVTRMIYLYITKQTKKDAAQKFYELMSGDYR